MSFYANVGYGFRIPDSVKPAGSVLICSAMPAHQLLRRRIDERYPHLRNRLFDPQLYLAGLDAGASPGHCANLASYEWFGIRGVQSFDSGQHTQPQWKKQAVAAIPRLWTGSAPNAPKLVAKLVRACIDFQIRIGCGTVTLPSPLTSDPSTSYNDELLWLDAGLEYMTTLGSPRPPALATIALADVCLRYSDPAKNSLLALIIDVVSARGVDGVYLVVEQGSEPTDTRQCGTKRTLWSVLHLTHAFARDAGGTVAANFLGPFGLACEAAGATWWASGWYKSLYRVRLADKLAGGRAYPSYWSYPSALDIHLERDFDAIAKAGRLTRFVDRTTACSGLLQAAARGTSVGRVPSWRYAQANVAAAAEHFLLSAVQSEDALQRHAKEAQLDAVEEWLRGATANAGVLSKLLGRDHKTKIAHVQSWFDAFTAYRRDHLP